jgi:hypothetical protein
MINRYRLFASLTFLLALLALAACGGSTPATGVSPEAQATIDALAGEVTALQTQVAALQPVAVQAESGADSSVAPVSPLVEPVEVAELPPTVSPTETPAPPTATPTPAPPPTPLPTFVPQPMDGEPPADRFRPAGRIGDFWAGDADRQQSLGWALEATMAPVDAVVQPFEHGLMIWRSDTGQILALWTEGDQRHWQAFEDTFEDGQMEFDPAITPPSGLRQPERGFGKVWREHPELRAQLGWALEKEQRANARIQAFERGMMADVGLHTYAIGQTPDGETTWDME